MAKRRRAEVIRVVAPAGPVTGDDLDRGLALLEGEGFAVREAPSLRAAEGYLAGPDAARREDLQAALDDPDVDVVWFARGGYGTTRVLDGLTQDGLRRHPKTLAGFSDATALHAWAQRVPGVRLLYAPGVQELARPGVCHLPSLWAALSGKPLPIEGRGPRRPEGPFPVVGGCLSLLSVLVGTPWEPAVAGRWLLLEDVGERLYRADRLMTHLAQAGWMERCAGLLLGGFTGMGEGESPAAVALRAAELLGPHKPLVSGLPVGHLTGKHTLTLERPARWDGRRLVFEG